MADVTRTLASLADHLAPDLAYELQRLIAADSQAHRFAEVASRAQRAEDLVRELQRQLTARDRQVDRLRAKLPTER